MPDHTEPNCAIEGDAVSGHSRDPLINRGLKYYNNQTVHRFKASFDIRTGIKRVLSEGTEKIEPDAFCGADDRIICETALIHSIKQRYSHRLVQGSAAHRANSWDFPFQTSVKIICGHQEIINAIQRRERIDLNLS